MNSQHSYIDPIIDQIDKYSITTLQELKSLIQTMSNTHYKFNTLKIGYQMVCAKKCDAFLKFSILNKNLIVASKNSLHIHKKNKPEGQSSKNKNQAKDKLMVIQEPKMKLNSASIINYTKLLDQIKKHKYEYISLFQSYNQIQLDCFLFISPNMEKNYRQYGEVLHFQLINNKFEFQNKIYNHLILFYGWDHAMNGVLFAYGFIKQQNVLNYQVLLTQFISLMNRSPQIMVIFNDNLFINKAINMVTASGMYAGNKIYNWFKILNELKMELNQQKIKLYEKMILTEDLNEYNSTVIKIEKGLSNQQELKIFNYLKQNSELICKCKIPDTFLAIFNEYNFKLRDEVIERIISENQIIEVVNIMDELDQKFNEKVKQYEKIQFEKYFSVQKLQNIRKSLHKTVFDKFIQQFFNRCNYEVNQINDKGFKLSEFNSKIEFQIVAKGKNYTCQCHLLEKQGLPCAHIIRMIEFKKGDLLNVINKRWISMKMEKDNEELSVRQING